MAAIATAAKMDTNVGKVEKLVSWPELLGDNNWEGLLDPLDHSLLNLILHAGDLCQVTYDSFNSDKNSPYCGACRYNTKHLLHKVFFPSAADYSVEEFIYSTADLTTRSSFFFDFPHPSTKSWSRETNWMGYIAVSTDEYTRITGRREIYVAWRGTVRNLEWADILLKECQVSIEDILDPNNPIGHGEEHPKIMAGWHSIYTNSNSNSDFTHFSAREILLTKIEELVERYKEDTLSILCVGHSLGGVLATLSAFDIVENGLSKIRRRCGRPAGEYFPVCALVFASPKVGNQGFKNRLDKLPNLKVLHVKNDMDLVPRFPPYFWYVHAATAELAVGTCKSPDLKWSVNPADWHNLQATLHAAAGWNGWHGKFELKVRRSLALVNKSSKYLKDEHNVPECWWVEKNKGMVVNEKGEWVVMGPDDEDKPRRPRLVSNKWRAGLKKPAAAANGDDDIPGGPVNL